MRSWGVFLSLICCLCCANAFAQEQTQVEPVVEALPAAAPATVPQKEARAAALLGVKKVSAERSNIEAPMNTETEFGTLRITVKQCVDITSEGASGGAALLLIEDHRNGEEPHTVFSGWMFSSSPSISALEHPVYDVTLTHCIW